MRVLSITALLLIVPIVAHAQVTISGIVQYESGSKPVDLANVIAQDPENNVIAYATTGMDGRFNLSVNARGEFITITVTGFNIERISRRIECRSQEITLKVKYRTMELPTAVIKTRPIKQTGDTTTYYVALFADSLDRSIGDVLKKMPGVSVDRSGGIRYQGKSISAFYVEGLDMMGARYGSATNNLRAEDIATVEVYENHQPIKLLRSIFGSGENGRVAINLKLKENAKGAFVGTAQLGVGYAPCMFDASGMGMRFKSSHQMLTTIKSNNSGKDIVSELKDQYNASPYLSSYLGVIMPATPDLDIERYMDNTTAAVSVNHLFKINADNIISINGLYINDKQKFVDSSLAKYYLPAASPIEIEESNSVIRKENTAEVRLKYTSNTGGHYLNEMLTVGSEWGNAQGSSSANGSLIRQQLGISPKVSISNIFGSAHPLGKKSTFSVSSKTYISNLTSELTVSPTLFPSLFGYGQNGAGQLQTMSNRFIKTDNSVGTMVSINSRTSLSVYTGIIADLQKATSELCLNEVTQTETEYFRNNVSMSGITAHVRMSLNYNYRKIKVFAGCDFNESFIKVKDEVRNTESSKTSPLTSPYLYFEYHLLPGWKINLNSSYISSLGPFSDSYSGYIMKDYRHFCTSNGTIEEKESFRQTLSLNHSNVLAARYCKVAAEYWRRRSNLMYGSTLYDITTVINSYDIDNVSSGLDVNGTFSQYISPINTTVELSAGYKYILMDILRQGAVMSTSTGVFSAGSKVIADVGHSAKIQYETITLRSSSTYGEGRQMSPVFALHQNLSINYAPVHLIAINVAGDHYYNDAAQLGTKNIVFIDASLSFKPRRIEYIIKMNNLLNQQIFSYRNISSADEYESNYSLRPRSVMVTVRFAL